MSTDIKPGDTIVTIQDAPSLLGYPIPKGSHGTVIRSGPPIVGPYSVYARFEGDRPGDGRQVRPRDVAVVPATPAPLDPKSVRKGDWIRLEDGPEADAAYAGGTVSHINENGFVTIDHLGTFAVDGLTTFPSEAYRRYQLTKHQPTPEPEPEWKPGTTGWAAVSDGDDVFSMRVMRVEWDGIFGFATESGRIIADEAAQWSVSDFVPDAPDPAQWVPMATAEKTEVEASRLRGRLNLRTVERDQMKERWQGVKMELALAQADLSDAQDAYEAAYRAAAPDLDMEDRTEPLAVVVERLRKKAGDTRPLPTRELLAESMHDDRLPTGHPRLTHIQRLILADAVLVALKAGESR